METKESTEILEKNIEIINMVKSQKINVGNA